MIPKEDSPQRHRGTEAQRQREDTRIIRDQSLFDSSVFSVSLCLCGESSSYRIAPATLFFGSSSSVLVPIPSFVSMSREMEAAFCSADRVTLVGSTMPALNMSSYSPVLAL